MDSAGNVEPIRSVTPRLVGKNIEPLVKVRHREYGEGHIAADYGHAIQIYWNKPFLAGLVDHLLLHDRSWVEQLERLE